MEPSWLVSRVPTGRRRQRPQWHRSAIQMVWDRMATRLERSRCGPRRTRTRTAPTRPRAEEPDESTASPADDPPLRRYLKIDFAIVMWTPFVPSTTCVTCRLPAIEHRTYASSRD